MDIQKEREAFEAWYRKEYDNTVIDDSEFSEILDEYESNYYWVDELNQSWKAWQAAKAQAVPEVKDIGNELQSWVAVWSFKARHDREDYIVVDANLLAEKIEKLTGANA